MINSYFQKFFSKFCNPFQDDRTRIAEIINMPLNLKIKHDLAYQSKSINDVLFHKLLIHL